MRNIVAEIIIAILSVAIIILVLGKPVLGYSPNIQEARQYARSQVNKGQWPCLDKLWANESGWSARQVTPSDASELRGAFGIPQAYPGKKMIRAIGWRDRYVGWKQARWGLNYIWNRHGTPCHALRFQNRNVYY